MENIIINRTVASECADHLRGRILCGEFKGGTALLQDAMASEYNISRIPLREALGTLEAEGLVISSPHKGSSVAYSSIEDMRDYVAIRSLVECDLLERGLKSLTRSTVNSAVAIVQGYESSVDCDVELSLRRDINWYFFRLVCENIDCDRSMQVLKSLHFSIDSIAYNKHLVSTDGRKAKKHYLGLVSGQKIAPVSEHRSYLHTLGEAVVAGMVSDQEGK